MGVKCNSRAPHDATPLPLTVTTTLYSVWFLSRTSVESQDKRGITGRLGNPPRSVWLDLLSGLKFIFSVEAKAEYNSWQQSEA